jgi:hypothetical protein
VTAHSEAVRSIEPVPPPLTNSSPATSESAVTISARRSATSFAEADCMVLIVRLVIALRGTLSPTPAI